MVEIVILNIAQHLSILLEFNTEYIEWIGEQAKKHHKINLEPILGSSHSYAARILDELETFQPPGGVFYLLQEGGSIVGMGALRKLYPGVGEVKRMYIKPDYQGKGYGKLLLNQLLKKSKELGYTSLWLDSGPFMKAAQHLYRSAGFVEIERYPEAESPDIEGMPWSFMEKKL